jgi:hypothetical protein
MTRENSDHRGRLPAMLRRLRDICYREYCGLCHPSVVTAILNLAACGIAALLLLKGCGGPAFSP